MNYWLLLLVWAVVVYCVSFTVTFHVLKVKEWLSDRA